MTIKVGTVVVLKKIRTVGVVERQSRRIDGKEWRVDYWRGYSRTKPAGLDTITADEEDLIEILTPELDSLDLECLQSRDYHTKYAQVRDILQGCLFEIIAGLKIKLDSTYDFLVKAKLA